MAGSIIASAIVLGTSKVKNDWSWRLPLIFQAIPPLIAMVCEIHLRLFYLNSLCTLDFSLVPPRDPPLEYR